MLTADPYILRQLAQQCLAASAFLQAKANRLQGLVQDTVQGPTGWRGDAAQTFDKRGEMLANEIHKSSNTLTEIAPILQTLAYRVENILYKKQELQRIESELQSLHAGWNVKNDVEIAYLESQAGALRVEINAESAYADMAAAAALGAMQISAAFSEEWAAFTQAASTAVKEVNSFVVKAGQGVEHVAEEAWDDVIKPAGKWIWNGIEEFLDIPEMESAWKDLMDPNKSWEDRLLAAGTLVVDGGLDISMLFGIGDVAKGVKFLATFGMKYGEKLLASEGRKAMAEAITKGMNQFGEGVRNGAEQLFGRGASLGDGLAFAGGGGGRSFGFSMERGGQTYRFSSSLNEEAKSKLEAEVSKVHGASSIGNTSVTTKLRATKLSSSKIEIDWLPDKYTAVEVNGTVKVAGKEVNVSRRVYQIDIDNNYVPNDPAANGLTNMELMAKGKAPYVVKNGEVSKVELHHLIQKEPGGMVEIAESTHDTYSSILHGLVEDGNSFRNDPDLEKQYNNFRSNYWKMRANE